MNCDEKAGDRLTVCEEELLWAFARLVSISSNFLFACVIAKCISPLKLMHGACLTCWL